jgi:hypothetical protein
MPVAPPRASRIVVAHESYGGAYGRPTAAGRDAARWLRDAAGLAADATYSAKALATALARGDPDELLFWLTYDDRWPAPGTVAR